MINIKLTIEYEGTKYHGWQRQKSLLSIQGILEEKISQITQKKYRLTVLEGLTREYMPWVKLQTLKLTALFL